VKKLAHVAWGWAVLCVMAARCVGQSPAPTTSPAGRPQQAEPFTSVAPPPSARFPASWYPPENDVAVHGLQLETDAPYTATMVMTTGFVDPKTGAVREGSMRTLQARDAEGRTRTETSMPRSGPDGQVVQAREIEVMDPVSHCSFRWMEPWAASGEPTAMVQCAPLKARYLKQNIFAEALVEEPSVEHDFGSEIRKEPLGRRVVNGVEAVGVRVTKTNTMPATGKVSRVVSEIWYAAEWKEMVEMKSAPEGDPTLSFDLVEIRRGAEAPLFYPPEGYKIVPEQAPQQR
jgi:hypothetical protein